MPDKVYFQNPALSKYAKIDLRGREAARQGRVEKYQPQDVWKNRFHASLVFSPESQEEVEDRIVLPVKRCAEENRIVLITPGEGTAFLHSTLLDAVLGQENEKRREEIFKQLLENEIFKELESKAKGQKLKYKYLLFSQKDIVLTDDEIPDWILEFRRQLTALYKQAGLEPLTIEHMLHTTVARVADFPGDEVNAQALKNFERQIVQLRHQISRQPLELVVAGVFKDNSYDLMTNPKYRKGKKNGQV